MFSERVKLTIRVRIGRASVGEEEGREREKEEREEKGMGRGRAKRGRSYIQEWDVASGGVSATFFRGPSQQGQHQGKACLVQGGGGGS